MTIGRMTAATAVLVLVGGSIAAAQVTIDLTPDVRTEFREYVVREKVAPVIVQEEVRVGAALPAEVTLSPLPPFIIERHPDLSTYSYVTVDDRIYIVHPETREVVTVVD